MLGPALTRSYPANNLRTVFDHLLCVKSPFTAREALHDEFRFFIYQNAHCPPPARATTFCAPSFMPLAMVKLRPELRRICWPSSTLVPSMRITTGIFT